MCKLKDISTRNRYSEDIFNCSTSKKETDPRYTEQNTSGESQLSQPFT